MNAIYLCRLPYASRSVSIVAFELCMISPLHLAMPLSKSGKELLVLFYILYPYYYRSCLGKQRSKTIYLHRTTVAHIFTLCTFTVCMYMCCYNVCMYL